jgi:ribosomal protein S18 acetylase RimI-like enzyme
MIKRRDIESGDADIHAMQSLCQRLWSTSTGWHIGDMAWGRRQHIGRDPEWPTAVWERHAADDAATAANAPDADVLAWAWVRLPGHLDLAIDPDHPELGSEIMAWFREVAISDQLVAYALDTEPHLIAAFEAAGFREVPDERFSWQYRHDLRSLAEPEVPDGFTLRPLRGDEDVPRRVDVHRSAFHPSRVTPESYANVRASWPYRQDLDWVVEAPDGRFAAFCLIWFDERNRAGLLEPVGAHQDFRRLGLAQAACLGAMRALRDLGATEAAVNSSGAADNPGPRALYHALGFVDHARTVKYVGDRETT